MAEPTVPVPVSLIERAERFNRRGGLGSEVHEWLRELAARLSQPTAEPPRIEYMAPGTTFTARTRDGALSAVDRFWMVAVNGWVFSTEAHHLNADRIDPSTIRDVTSPKEDNTPTT